ncbi:PAX-interacting protein 1 isoform X6 [Macrosteles quadrilineatus]|uniref:PAX-interacting protein 1 isoform X6 n=1 Tax=Macrosteles quadrilineatus TaxID=74068 RepID=UPI0023E24D94|nr:PAX-interacting protein 1 isoform X6 [Macrosteles quadrilineatus]
MDSENSGDKPKLFGKVKYKITGKVDEEIEQLLQNNGAEGFSYFSDYVTHCIVGTDPVDTDISDANELYEVPAVTPEWVSYSLKCNKLLPTSAFKGGEKLLFTGVVAHFSKLTRDDHKKLWAMLKFYGGVYSSSFNKNTTHLIVSKPEGEKYEQALKCSDIIHVVTPDWLIDSVRTNSLCAEILYHPRLLIIEKPQKSDYQSTAHITGFADDVVPDENSSSGIVPSSEILQQLKLRMPWNQPSQTVSSASSTAGPMGGPLIQKQAFTSSQMGLAPPRPMSTIMQQNRPQIPQHQLLQQRTLQQQRLIPQSQWRPQNQLQQQQMGQKPGLQPIHQPQNPNQRQLIQMDKATHAQLRQLDPQQRTMFLHNLQKQQQIAIQRQMQQQQQQQRQVVQGGGIAGSTVVVSGALRQQSVAVIRGHIPSGLNPQQQLQWLQQQRHQQQIVIQQNTQLRQQVLVHPQQGDRQMPAQQLITSNSPTVAQQPQWVADAQLQGQVGVGSQQQMALRQQQLQLHRFQQLQQKQQVPTANVRLAHPTTPQPMLFNNQMAQGNTVAQGHQPIPEAADSVASSTDLFSGNQQGAGQSQAFMVNAKTKTALANMLSIRLQTGQSGSASNTQMSSSVEGSAAGQLRLMTAQHIAQQLQPPPPTSAPTPQPTPTQMRGPVGVQSGSVPVRVGVTMKTECGPVTPPAVLGPANKPPYTQTAARVAAVLAKSAAATQPPQHHQRPQFFGHNPNLKLPQDMFLLGCIFLIVEYDRTGDNISEWTHCITEYGGEVEGSYTLRVTHIICQTQKHPLVQQGIRDGKRCVTAEWLSDVCLKQQVLPPWLALHFPTPYSEEKPCRNLIITYSGFEGEERSKIKKMIEATGAKLTNYLSSQNNILVCRRPDGSKYRRARELGKSVVNVQWLNEILFGHYSCLQQPDSHKYQQYHLGNPFRIEYILVPHLMAAWKAPINVTQESYERLKNNPPNPRKKKPRIVPPSHYVDNNVNENKDCMMEGIEVINHNPPPPEKRPYVLFSGIYGDELKEEAKKVVMLGGVLVQGPNEATHLVMVGMGITVKLYESVTTCKHIVNLQWVTDSFARSQFVDESPYIYSNPELEKQYNFKLAHTLSMPNRRNLFKGKKFFLSPCVIPGRNALRGMIEYAGGSVDRQRRSLKFMLDMEPLSYFVIAVPKDYHLVADVLRSNLGVYPGEFVLTCLLRQSIEHEAATMVVKRNNKQGR